jgi:peptide-methionine (S)-S-oxide reductase
MSLPSQADSSGPAKEVATLGGGCFWCLEAVFEQLRGVLHVESGYAGGTLPAPTYRQVCNGNTGHAEVVQITFDPKVVSFQEILDVFFATHDPTTLNCQGPDAGTQYRSVILYHSPQQQQAAQQKIAELNAAGIWDSPLVTEVVPLGTFYRAEDYHQGYFRGNPQQPYCLAIVSPKVAKFRKRFADKLQG